MQRQSLRMSVLANDARRKIKSPGLTMKSILKIDGVKLSKKSELVRDDVDGEIEESIFKTVVQLLFKLLNVLFVIISYLSFI